MGGVSRGSKIYAAVDLGAESGRIVVGGIDGDRAGVHVVHRFPNRPLRLNDGLHWNLPGLFQEILRGLNIAARQGPLAGVAVTAWGVDYALLDSGARMLGLPFHYRDGRTKGMSERAFARIPSSELYAATGIQTLPIATLYQLLAEEDEAAIAAADSIALIPDLITLWLSGERVNELTAASTTGLLDARKPRWARAVIARLGLPVRLFEREPVSPALELGNVLACHGKVAGVPVHLVAGHDTASAFAAVPLGGPGTAVLSSGTWSLLGVELDSPILSSRARAYDLSNERGADGSTRLLKNVMGLWLLEECRRHWRSLGHPVEYERLQDDARHARSDVALFDPDDGRLLSPGEMPRRIAELCVETHQPAPGAPAEYVRSILVSLACKYRFVLERLESVTGVEVETVHVVGGGTHNSLLSALTADFLGRPVVAAHVEATALGNVLAQALAAGELGSWAELRAIASAGAEARTFEPARDQRAAETYERFLDVTSLASEVPTLAIP